MIYLAVGAQKSAPLNIPGEDAEGCFRCGGIPQGLQPGERESRSVNTLL